jgi:hypothetical protein
MYDRRNIGFTEKKARIRVIIPLLCLPQIQAYNCRGSAFKN